LGRNTPLGQTRVIAKVEHPSWYPPASIRKEHADAGDPLPAVVGPGPDNPLGDYKIRLGFGDGTYEIHGTNNPTAVGVAITHGCIRMYPEDVAALFPQLPVATSVRLINVPVEEAWIEGELLLEAHPPVNAQGESFEPDVQLGWRQDAASSHCPARTLIALEVVVQTQRGVFRDWVEALAEGVAEVIAHPSPLERSY
jgi:hypothetical protein